MTECPHCGNTTEELDLDPVRYVIHDPYGICVRRFSEIEPALEEALFLGPECALFEVDDDGVPVRMITGMVSR